MPHFHQSRTVSRNGNILLCFALIASLIACNNKKPLFEKISSEKSGIHFNNQVDETPYFNVLNYEYIYNGGGVGIGDFNNDSLPDIYFTGSRVSNKLYLNKGNLQFEDVTQAAHVEGEDKWCKGVSIVDINNDGLQDIYVCAAVADSAERRRNILYVNKGVDPKTGIPQFTDEALAYGLADEASTQMAAFFDFDNDGDLDVYLLENDIISGVNPNDFRSIKTDGSWPNTDKLLRNDANPSLGHPVFTDVSKQAGIQIEGYGLGVNITDINNDGWSDIYVSNDYVSNNLLYINNKNGTFTEQSAQYFKHTSRNAMGNDIADINNDGRQDIIELDMAPADNFRLKMMNSPISYQNFQTLAYYGYQQQYVRNCLQLNMGPRYTENDSLSAPIFSEVGYLSGIAQTDWSWAPLALDVDNDGYRDLMISNGLPKDLTDQDFIAYRQAAISRVGPEIMLKQLPSIKISNYIFKNSGNISFQDMTKAWGWDEPGFSAGMAYADFDKDGDMDVIVNNTEMEAFLMKNTVNDEKSEENHYINIKLKGDSSNTLALGSSIRIYTKDEQQFYEYTPYRGYMSTIENIAHFGLGKHQTADSILITWPNHKVQKLENVASGQNIFVEYDAHKTREQSIFNQVPSSLFREFTLAAGMTHRSMEDEFIDFNVQRLIPHKLSQYGPAIAAGDLNGDGLDDLVIGGGSPVYASLYFQQSTGTFSHAYISDTTKLKMQDDAGICIFDAEGDGDNDIFIASGGSENLPNSTAFADHFYVNDGKGNFTEDFNAFEKVLSSKSCVKACDYDKDGDLDLFVGGRLMSGNYPKPVNSILWRNDSRNGKAKFTNVTTTVAPALENIGMVTDASWVDENNDGETELMIVGEWMSPTTLSFKKGVFQKIENGMEDYSGWWNSISKADIDNDGDIDVVLGNYGTNGYVNPTKNTPVKIYGKDFDNSMSFDAIVSTHTLSTVNGKIAEHPLAMREDMVREMNFLRDKFPNYTTFAQAEMKDILTQDDLKGALILEAVEFRSCWMENKGDHEFEMHALPIEAQFSPVYGMIARDVNADGNLDLMLTGNEFSMTAGLGRYDAANGLLLLGDGKGAFKSTTALQSGIYIPGNGKSLAEFSFNGQYAIASGCNNGRVQLFRERNKIAKALKLNKDDMYALVKLKNGQQRREEFMSGSSFYSQSSSIYWNNPSYTSITVYNNKGVMRTLKP